MFNINYLNSKINAYTSENVLQEIGLKKYFNEVEIFTIV